MKLAPIAAQKSECAIGTCYNWTIGPRFRLVRTFDLAPPSGRVALGGRFPGLKPWAEFCSPCGAQNKGLSPRIVGLQPFGANHPIPYLRAILTDPFILAAPWSHLAAIAVVRSRLESRIMKPTETARAKQPVQEQD